MRGGWGRMVEPVKNAMGFRDCHVRVGSRLCPPPEQVIPLMRIFTASLPSLGPEKAYLQFEEIHGFRDANGRTGKILFNWLKFSLDRPQMPPNFFGVANP